MAKKTELMAVEAKDLQIIEYRGLRVVTTEQLAAGYGATEKMISNNFSRNQNRFIEGKHYFDVEGEELQSLKNLPSLRGVVYCLHTDNIGTQSYPETFGEDDCISLSNVVQLSTYKKSVGQPSGDSLAFLRCRRLISPIAALTKKAAVLSLSSFTDSISCSTSCGTLTFTCFDLLFIEPVAISGLLGNRCDSVYAKKRAIQCLTCYSPSNKVNSTLSMSGYQNGNAPECGNTTEASNHTVIGANNMACSHDTQTRPKFVYLFLGTPNEFPDSTPTVLRAEADTEDDARAKFPRWTLTFAAQIRTAAPCRLQIFSTDDGFMWVYEHRQAVQEEAHA